MNRQRNPSTVVEAHGLRVVAIEGDTGLRHLLSFRADEVAPLARALRTEGRDVNGPTAEQVLVRLAEKGAPDWGLVFDSEADAVSVWSSERAPLVHLLRRFAKRLDDPAAMRRLVREVPDD
jgi:hypothetical protein